MILDLNGVWKLGEFSFGAGEAAGAFEADFNDSGWLPVTVPGDVHTALQAAGRIPDPFYGMNAEGCRWVEEKDWWYRRRFALDQAPLPEERVYLNFQGLDTYATVWLNGKLIARGENMFVPVEAEITGQLRPGENVLAVCFTAAMHLLNDADVADLWGGFYTPRVWARKAQMNWGWDWGPHLVTAGIWRPAAIRSFRGARLTDLWVRTERIEGNTAWTTIEADLEAWETDKPLAITFSLAPESPGITAPPITVSAPVLLDAQGHGHVMLGLPVPEAALWWTHDLGRPHRYRVSAVLQSAEGDLDTQSRLVGLRTIEVRQEPGQEPGTRNFTFVLNGIPLYCRGANWIPADNCIGAIPAERYRDLLTLARDANMNMLRVWGGGIYEHPAFYETCDALGILVWQDFMFACAAYPDTDPHFLRLVEAEARHVVRQLRHHPCLALWCGNNENDWIDNMTHWDRPEHPFHGRTIYHELLPAVCAELDPSRCYWPSSPYGGNDHNAVEEGDRHNWQVWAGQVYPRHLNEPSVIRLTPEGVTYRLYARDHGRFISEFGIHGAPVLETLRRNIPAAELRYESEQFNYRNKDFFPERKAAMMEAHTGQPRFLEEYIEFSMLVQAEGLKFGIEHYRRRKFECSGSLVWQLNDCWPGISWSIVDYYLIPKAAYYAVRRAFAPLMLSFREEEHGISLWGSNDTLEAFTGDVEVGVAPFTGAPRSKKGFPIQLPANTSGELGHWSLDTFDLRDATRECLYVRCIGSACVPGNHYFLTPYKEMHLPEADLDLSLRRRAAEEAVLRVTAGNLARLVRVVEHSPALRLSDNFFDLLPGETGEIIMRGTLPEEITVAATNECPRVIRMEG